VRTFPQRADSTKVVMNVGDVDHVHAVDAAAVPREEAISRAARQPADVAEVAAETEVESPSSPAESEEGHISRRPDRIVSGIYWPGPPTPVPAINEPASVVIRRPSPGLVGNPGPAVVRLVHPTSIAIRGPIRAVVGKPYLSVIRDVPPTAIGV